MALRVLKVVVPQSKRGEIPGLFEGIETSRVWSVDINEGMSEVTVVLASENVEELADKLTERFSVYSEFRLVVLAAEATRPKLPEPKPVETESTEPVRPAWKPLIGRLSREELQEDLGAGGKTSPLFVSMVVLSTIVACVGLIKDSASIIIGAMVIAPLLAPNMALALGTTLGDTALIKQSLRSNLVGVGLALLLATAIGLVIPNDPAQRELAARAAVDAGDVALALASGAAGALAVTVGTSGTLVGVMVAVALLPPTCACGLFLGAGLWREAAAAAHLLAINVVGINIAAKTVFLVQRIGPTTWWDSKRAKKATRHAMLVWVVLLAIVVALLFVKLI